jgi:hypothetical protein
MCLLCFGFWPMSHGRGVCVCVCGSGSGSGSLSGSGSVSSNGIWHGPIEPRSRHGAWPDRRSLPVLGAASRTGRTGAVKETANAHGFQRTGNERVATDWLSTGTSLKNSSFSETDQWRQARARAWSSVNKLAPQKANSRRKMLKDVLGQFYGPPF